MIVSRRKVIWSGIIIVILFAIINRVRLYVNSEIILGKIERNYEDEDVDNYNLTFQYSGNTYTYNYKSSIEIDETLPVKILIPFDSPEDFVVFNFHNYVFWVILIVIFMSGGWILFLQSFYPKRDKFFLFRTKKEPDDEEEEE